MLLLLIISFISNFYIEQKLSRIFSKISTESIKSLEHRSNKNFYENGIENIGENLQQELIKMNIDQCTTEVRKDYFFFFKNKVVDITNGKQYLRINLKCEPIKSVFKIKGFQTCVKSSVFFSEKKTNDAMDSLEMNKLNLMKKFKLNKKENEWFEIKYKINIANCKTDSIQYKLIGGKNITYSFNWPQEEWIFKRRYYYNHKLLKIVRILHKNKLDLNKAFFDYSSPRIYSDKKDCFLMVFDIKDATGLMATYSVFSLISTKESIISGALKIHL